jgi:signal transduction histidine kinase/CheY-like chemotaxis protein
MPALHLLIFITPDFCKFSYKNIRFYLNPKKKSAMEKLKSEINKQLQQQEILSDIAIELNSLDDFDIRINNTLKKIGQHTDVSRVYIFEDQSDELATDNTFEWCNSGIEPQLDQLKDIPYEIIPNWKKLLFEKGRVYSENISELPKDIRSVLEPQGIISIIVYPLNKNGVFFGFIGFDECINIRKWSRSELELLRTISAIIGNTFGRRDAENELVKAKESAEKASMAKAQFLSTMSHEIRTPMNAVIGLTYLLLQDDPKPEQLQNLKILKFSAENLLGIINDILDFSKIEAGKIALEEEDIVIRDLLDGIIYSFSPKTLEKGIFLKANIDENVPEVILSDQLRLSQILNNLLSNAVKFTNTGGITIEIRQKQKLTSAEEIEFRIIDTGIGIPESKHKSIFNEFTQADNNTTRLFGGTGLGLAITSKLLELFNSKIELWSKPGEGSIFSFTLHLKTGIRSIEKKVKFESINDFTLLTGRRILVVEDNKVNQIIAQKFLKQWGINITIAENGKEALKKLENDHFELILMDLQMPEMDGYETTQRIRSSNTSYQNIPIIALSASAMLQIRDKALVIGMNDFVTKPFNPNELYAKMLNLLERK